MLSKLSESRDFDFDFRRIPAVRPGLELDDSQHAALKRIKAWDKRGVLQVGGRAGTGKTTLIKELVRTAGVVVPVLAYTNKACQVLRGKGVEAQTIHSFMYQKISDKPLKFERKRGVHTGVVIVDEASMINAAMAADLQHIATGVIAVGDIWQLPPVNAAPFFTVPDVILTEVHRQENADILDLAEEAHYGRPYGKRQNAVTAALNDDSLEKLRTANQVLCSTNRTRGYLNHYLRMMAGKSPYPEAGDTMTAFERTDAGMINGFQYEVAEVMWVSSGVYVTLRDVLDSTELAPIFVDPHAFRTKSITGEKLPFDFDRVLTVHKAQGSEWDRVGVVKENSRADDSHEWLYTAVTRGRKQVLVLTWDSDYQLPPLPASYYERPPDC